MAKKKSEPAAQSDPLKLYCIVFGILIVVVGIAALQRRSTLKSYQMANRAAHNMLVAKGRTPDGRPLAVGELAVEVEKFVQGFQKSVGDGESGGSGISTTKMKAAEFQVHMEHSYASPENDTPNRGKGFRTRSREFTYNPATLDQLTRLIWNIEKNGRYRVFELRWKLADKKTNSEPPYNRVTKPVLKVGFRQPLTKER
jgi:hypothetical protein